MSPDFDNPLKARTYRAVFPGGNREGIPMAQLTQQIRIDTDPAQYGRMFDRETGLPRWPLLVDRTTIALARANRCHRVAAVFVIENPRAFDGTVPDFAQLGRRLQARVRPDDTVARAAHRTLVVVCNDISRDSDAATVARRLVHSSGALCQLGVALSSREDSAQSLLERAIQEADQVLAG
jgi:hypothetical protein